MSLDFFSIRGDERTGSDVPLILTVPSAEEPSKFVSGYPCRCGKLHESYQAYRSHQCFHMKLSIIGARSDGKLVVYCSECECAWFAPVVAEGLAVSLTEPAMASGCGSCRSKIMDMIGKGREGPDKISYECSECGEVWNLHKEVENDA